MKGNELGKGIEGRGWEGGEEEELGGMWVTLLIYFLVLREKCIYEYKFI